MFNHVAANLQSYLNTLCSAKKTMLKMHSIGLTDEAHKMENCPHIYIYIYIIIVKAVYSLFK